MQLHKDRRMNESDRSVNEKTHVGGGGGTRHLAITRSTLVKGETVLTPILNHYQLNLY